MYHKVIVMEIKEEYALAMEEDGRIIRIRKKDGIQIGSCIYVLEEDLHWKEVNASDPAMPVSFTDRKKKYVGRSQGTGFWRQITAVAAAAALFLAVFAWVEQPGTAYAMVSVDGEESLELLLDRDRIVKEAVSFDGSVPKYETDKMVGQKLDALKGYFPQGNAAKGKKVIGYALYKKETAGEQEALRRRLEYIFGTEKTIYISGDSQDIEAAKKAKKSLGMYLTEKGSVEELEESEEEKTKQDVIEESEEEKEPLDEQMDADTESEEVDEQEAEPIESLEQESKTEEVYEQAETQDDDEPEEKETSEEEEESEGEDD